jgi:hypothetical protein
MKKWIKILGALTAVGLLAAVLGYVFIYNKSHPNYEKMKPEFQLTASALFEAYRSNQSTAESLYNGKMIAVEGSLSELIVNESATIAYFTLDEGMFGDEGVRITMLEGQNDALNSFEPGSLLTIKGFVSGYNQTDVVLVHGSLIE